MKRYAAFDPPEYLSWTRTEAAVREYGGVCARDEERRAIIDGLSEDQLLGFYRGLLRTRLTDIALKRFVRQGVISKAWLGTGEEAATVGPVHALRRPLDGVPVQNADVVAPMIRNSGACAEMGMPIADIFRSYMATGDAPTRGRDGHYGDMSFGVLPPISHVGDMIPIVTGIALSFRMNGYASGNGGGGGGGGRVAVTWIGDGSTKAGATHEGFNFAAVQKVPAIFIIQNNQVALGTRIDQHHLCEGPSRFSEWPKAYGMWGGVFDGNNVLDAYALTSMAVERCRRGEGPALLIAETFRMGGHATHDEAEARRTFDAELFGKWGVRDPIGLYEEYLADHGVARDDLGGIEADVEAEVERAQEEALESRKNAMPRPESAMEDVYARKA